MSTANVVDSSGWLEYIANSDRASLFASAIEDTANLAVPVISIYEVFKKVLRLHGEDAGPRIVDERDALECHDRRRGHHAMEARRARVYVRRKSGVS